MKDEFSGQTKFRRGFSTLEILIAMAILILVLSSVIMVAFGGQAILSDNEIAGEALKKAQELLEVEQARARKDFKLVNPVPEVEEIVGGLTYKKWVEVETASDYLTKEITSIVAWTGEHGRNLDIRLTALVTNFEYAVGGDTCNSVVTGQNWLTPAVFPYAVSTLSGITGNFPVADIDVANGMMYVAVNDSNVNTNSTLFVFDASANPPTYKGSIDNDDNTPPTISRTKEGINAIHAAGNYVYAASAITANFTTCLVSENCAQLQIFNVSDPSAPILSKYFKLPNSLGASGSAYGKSIFYKDGYIYLGLTKTASGPEFNIIDVHNPLNPIWIGGWSAGNAVNDIYVKGKYAYVAVATAVGQELFVLDISNPVNPVAVSPGGFDAPSPGIGGYGKSIYAVGDTLYFGRTFESSVSGEEFYILNNGNPASSLPLLGARPMDESVNEIIVRDFLGFILTNDNFRIFDISNPALISSIPPVFTMSLSEKSKALECEGNTLYIGSGETESDIGTITVVKPGL